MRGQAASRMAATRLGRGGGVAEGEVAYVGVGVGSSVAALLAHVQLVSPLLVTERQLLTVHLASV